MTAIVYKRTVQENQENNGLEREDLNGRSLAIIKQAHLLSGRSKEIRAKGKELVEMSKDLHTKGSGLIDKSEGVLEKGSEVFRHSNKLIADSLRLRLPFQGIIKKDLSPASKIGSGNPAVLRIDDRNTSGESGILSGELSILDCFLADYLEQLSSRNQFLASRADIAISTARKLITAFNLARFKYQRNAENFRFLRKEKYDSGENQNLI